MLPIATDPADRTGRSHHGVVALVVLLAAGQLAVEAPSGAGNAATMTFPDALDLRESAERLSAVDAVLNHRASDLDPAVRRAVAFAIVEECEAVGLDPLLILAVMDVESDFREYVVSPMGAAGLMQIRPATLSYLAGKYQANLPLYHIAHDSTLSTRLGIRYLASLRDRFRTLELALIAYNIGPTALRDKLADKEGVLDRSYAHAVMRDYRGFVRLASGRRRDAEGTRSSN